MIKLKRKIKTIPSLLEIEKKKFSIINLLYIFFIIILIVGGSYLTYKHFLPYIKAVNINNVVGKKIHITRCNTKDYIIINKDKAYSMSLTNDNCETNHYEGDLIIKYNTIIFKYVEKKESNKAEEEIIEHSIEGTIDKNNNIIINNNKFESEDNNENTNK